MSAENVELARLMADCSAGKNSALLSFFESFLESQLLVPERHQQVTAKIEPRYPSDFCNILGVVDGERVVVPVFTDGGLVADWSGNPLRLRRYVGSELVKIIPDGWWCSLNPGQECSKEFSPWEINELRHGKNAIQTVVEEYLSGEELEPLTIGAVADDEYQDLKAALVRAVEGELPTILEMTLVRETGLDDGNNSCSRLLLGASTIPGTDSSVELSRERLQNIAGLHSIGAEDIYVFVGERGKDKVMMNLFTEFRPFYSRR